MRVKSKQCIKCVIETPDYSTVQVYKKEPKWGAIAQIDVPLCEKHRAEPEKWLDTPEEQGYVTK